MGDVPDQTCNANLPKGDRTFTRYLDTDRYTNPAPDPVTGIATHRGNERRNNLQQPRNQQLGYVAGQELPTTGGRSRAAVRTEAFNVLNHAQWLGINTYDDREVNPASQSGYVTGARNGRHMQLALKFVF
jgi:hypothetical protein